MPKSDGWKNIVGTRQSLEKGTERTKRIASMGGKASAIKKKANAMIAEMLRMGVNEKTQKAVQKEFGALDDITMMSSIVAGQIRSAANGNTNAFKMLLEVMEKAEDIEAQAEALRKRNYHVDLDMIADSYHAAIRDIRKHRHLEYLFKGGRGSTKSTMISMMIPELMKNNPDIHALCVRKVGNTLQDSVYAQIKWALGKQEIEEEFDATKKPLEITIKATGQKIYFRGADDKGKIKSITPTFGYIGILWLEELDQFEGDEEVRSITQSAIRGGDVAWIFKSYNPPKSTNNWVNQYVKVPKDNLLIHHSTYEDVPKEWLGQPFLEEAEHLKKVNPEAYEHEYLGIPNGEGGAVFTQLEIREITDEEIEEFDHIYQGIDWGLAPDPFAFVRLHYDRDSETIYFIDEYVVRGARNVQTAEELESRGYNDFPVTCDSAEKKSTLDYRDMGFNARNAKKGAGSVEYGMKWLAGRRIVIDPKRTPTVHQEYTQYEFEHDKNGNLVTGYPDRDNHTIDATRYALEQYCNRRYETA